MIKRLIAKLFLDDNTYQCEYVNELIVKQKENEFIINLLQEQLKREIEININNRIIADEIYITSNRNGNKKIKQLSQALVEKNNSSIETSKNLLNRTGYKNIPNTDYTIKQIKIQQGGRYMNGRMDKCL